MTSVIKSPRHDGYKSLDEELYHKINTRLTILVIIVSCLVAFTAIIISETAALVTPISSEEKAMNMPPTDLGLNSDGLPVDGHQWLPIQAP